MEIRKLKNIRKKKKKPDFFLKKPQKRKINQPNTSEEEVGKEEISNANLSSIRPETVNGYLCQKKGHFAASFSDLAFNSTLKRPLLLKRGLVVVDFFSIARK